MSRCFAAVIPVPGACGCTASGCSDVTTLNIGRTDPYPAFRLPPCMPILRPMEPIADTFDAAFSKTVDLANKMADKDKDADLWDIADGLLAGAIQYWLYSRQPCGDSRCQDCMPISTAEGRMSELKRLIEQLASESEYFHTPTDSNAGRA